MLNENVLKGFYSKSLYSIFLISASLDYTFLPAQNLSSVFSFGEVFYCYLLQMFSCKMSVQVVCSRIPNLEKTLQEKRDIILVN